MIQQIITWLRRDDARLEILRREIQQQEKPVDWAKIQLVIVYILFALSMVGFAFVGTLIWISL